MKQIIKNLVLGFLLFLETNSFAGTIDPNIPDVKYLEYGQQFKCIVEIMGSYEESGQLFSASCVAIDPHWVLTAAHVVKGNRFVFIYNQDLKKMSIIDEVIIHNSFDDKEYGFGDIALCYISSDIGLEFYPDLYEDSDEVNKVCSISGYGKTGTFLTGMDRGDGKRRAGSNKIDRIENDLLICSPSLLDKTSLEFLICSGDSGGGLFIDGKLAGINSCVTAIDKRPNSTYNDDAGHTRVSKFIDWIRNNMQKKRDKF